MVSSYDAEVAYKHDENQTAAAKKINNRFNQKNVQAVATKTTASFGQLAPLAVDFQKTASFNPDKKSATI